MKDYSAYLFDMDGTLVDSEKLKGMALVKTCSLFGGTAELDDYKAVERNRLSALTFSKVFSFPSLH